MGSAPALAWVITMNENRCVRFDAVLSTTAVYTTHGTIQHFRNLKRSELDKLRSTLCDGFYYLVVGWINPLAHENKWELD